MKLTNTKTETYHIWNCFYCDIVEGKNDYEGWLYEEGCGHKMFVYGLPKDSGTKEELLEYIEKEFIDDAGILRQEVEAIENMWYEKLNK